MRLLIGIAMFSAVCGAVWAGCPDAPRRPACIPEVGSFADAREAERCEEETQDYAAKMAKVYRCETDGQRKQDLRRDAGRVRQDFEDAADGLIANTPGEPGVPPDVPNVGGQPQAGQSGLNVDVNGLNGAQGGGLPPGVFADGTGYGVPATDSPVPIPRPTPGRGW